MDKKKDNVLFIISLVLFAISGSLLIMSITSDMNIVFALAPMIVATMITTFRIKKKGEKIL